MKVAIIDSGTDLQKLYNGERHSYEAVWIPVENFDYRSIQNCDLIIIPVGTDNTLLSQKKSALQTFVNSGGWIFCFDGLTEDIIENVQWKRTPRNYRNQSFSIGNNYYSSLLKNVSFEELACKDDVRGWWCEGELYGNNLTPLIIDECGRIVAAILPSDGKSGCVILTAAARLPIFSSEPTLAPNIFFSNLIEFCRHSLSKKINSISKHIYVHSGNWAHRSFLQSERFCNRFYGIHWASLTESSIQNAPSIWIPWESNVRALKKLWPLLQAAVNEGSILVVEDMREGWLPDFTWFPRSVDSTWWRHNRSLDLHVSQYIHNVLPAISIDSFFWHYHGVFDCPPEALPLLNSSDGKCILATYKPHEMSNGCMFISTLDATFEYGAGKIDKTANFIEGMLAYIATYYE